MQPKTSLFPSFFRTIQPATWSWIAAAIAVVGGLVRLVVYYQNRSLFLDEANLARNFVEKDYLDFFSPLNYEQYSPPLFSWIEQSQIQLWGVHEYALRLFPLVCSLASLYFLYRLSQRLLQRPFLLMVITWIIAFSTWFIRYGTEVKQYSSDILLGILLPYLAFRERPLAVWWWAVIGVVATWMSMPAVFFLAGIGLHYLWQSVTVERPFQITSETKKWLAVIGIWLISFGIYYFGVLRPNVNSNYLQDYHEQFFLPLFPTDCRELKGLSDLLLSIFKTGFGYTVPAYLFGVGGTVSALFFAGRGQIKPAILFILLTPILLCLLASGLHFYSLIPRLTLFFIPALLLWTMLGWEKLLQSNKRWVYYFVIILGILTASIHRGYQYLQRPYLIEEVKPLLPFLAQRIQPEDQLYVHHHAVPAFVFYTTQHADYQQFKFKQVHLADWQDRPFEVLQHSPNQRHWLLFSHLISEEANQELAGLISDFNKKENFELVKDTIGVKLYLYTKDSKDR